MTAKYGEILRLASKGSHSVLTDKLAKARCVAKAWRADLVSGVGKRKRRMPEDTRQ